MKQIKQSIIPEFISGSSTQVVAVNNARSHSRGFLSGIFHAYPPSPRCICTRPSPSRERVKEGVLTLNPSGARENKLSPSPVGEKVAEGRMRGKGFTLIELLVVVLIIAILAAVALPQYQKAVEKAKAIQAIALLKPIYQAYQAYELEHGVPPSSFAQLEVEIPLEPTTTTDKQRANKDWQVSFSYAKGQYEGINMRRQTGPYAGTRFYIWNRYQNFSDLDVLSGTILCVEDKTALSFSKKGYYCQQLFNAKWVYTGYDNHYYQMP